MPNTPRRRKDSQVPDAIITSVKNNTSFLSLLSQYGIASTKKGKSLFATCPFHTIDGHAENTASLSIDPVTNLYHCFSCNARGNVIQFVMEMDKVTFPEAVDKLLAVKGSKLEKAAKGRTADAVTVPPDGWPV